MKLIILYLIMFSFSSGSSKPSYSFNIKDSFLNLNAKISSYLPQANLPWMDAYLHVIESSGMDATHITLIDVDFDNIPELFLSRLGTSNVWIYGGFTFKNGKVLDITISDESIPADLELYIDKTTKEKFWVASGMFRDVSLYNYVWDKIDFSDLSLVKKSFFFSWYEKIVSNGSGYDVIYALLDSNNNPTEVTEEELYNSKKDLFSKYEHIETFNAFSFVDDFLEVKDGNYNEEHINEDLVYTFFKLYESKRQIKPSSDLESPVDLPVQSIFNYNTYSQSQFGQYPISLVQEGYRKLDDNTQTNINIQYIQISRLNNPLIMGKINNTIKEDLFFDWDLKKAEGLELNISQSATIKGDFLNIITYTSCFAISAPHPWKSMTGTTFNIKTGEKVKLSDIIQTDERLKEKFTNGYLRCTKTTNEESIDLSIYDDLYEQLLEYPYESFYLTDFDIGFILQVSHAEGDYWTFEIPYEQVSDLLLQLDN